VVDASGVLLGSISKNDLMLAIVEQGKSGGTGSAGSGPAITTA